MKEKTQKIFNKIIIYLIRLPLIILFVLSFYLIGTLHGIVMATDNVMQTEDGCNSLKNTIYI